MRRIGEIAESHTSFCIGSTPIIVTDLNVTNSDLYNFSKDSFEMWEPKYGTTVVAPSTVSNVTDSSCKIAANYYTDETKTALKVIVTITISKSESLYCISSIQ